MPFRNSRLPLSQAKTDLPRKSQRTRTSKPPAPRAHRSAPAQLPPPFVYPETPASLFLPLTVDLFPGDHPVDMTATPPATPSPTGEYAAAIARLDADATLTTHQKLLLNAAMNTAAHCFGRPGEVHSLIHTIASPLTPVSTIVDLVTVVGAGMRAFIAQSGPSTSSSGSSASSSSRRGFVKTACATRDNSTCVVTGRRAGTSCHIVPFSVRGEKAEHFWAFVAMFKGTAATQQLKLGALGPAPSSPDNIRNVVWLSPDTHTCFDNGQLAMVPVMANGAPYDPATVTEYNVRVELPRGAADVDLSVWTTGASGRRQTEVLVSGHTLTLRTPDPAALPLPHPILFQLHTAFTRLRKMCASAGIPILPDSSAHSQDGDYMELSEHSSVLDYQAIVMRDKHQDGPLLFEENDEWPVTSSGYPLKERYLQLLCDGQQSESDQYHDVIEHWTPSDKGTLDVDMQDTAKVLQVMPPRKRGFEQLYYDGSSASDQSRPVTDARMMKRSNNEWGLFGVFSGVGDGGSE